MSIEVGVDADVHDAPEVLDADPVAQVEERGSVDIPVATGDLDLAVLLRHEQPAVGEEGKVGRVVEAADDRRHPQVARKVGRPPTMTAEGVGGDRRVAHVTVEQELARAGRTAAPERHHDEYERDDLPQATAVDACSIRSPGPPQGSRMRVTPTASRRQAPTDTT